jgi:hypothetical protein
MIMRKGLKVPSYGRLEKLLFHPISSLHSIFYPRNILYMPVVKNLLRLEFERSI